MKKLTGILGLLTVTSLALCASQNVLAAEAEAHARCENLLSLSAPEFRVDAAQWMEAGDIPSGPGGATSPVPAHCLFRVVIDPRESDIEGPWTGMAVF